MAAYASREAPVAVIDAPLLLEAGWSDLCDSLVFVEACRANRLERTSLRNWSAGEIVRREATQMPIEEKRRLATWSIRNDGSRDELADQVESLWNSILSRDPKSS